MDTSADRNPSVLIKQKAFDLGFDLFGIAPSKILGEHKEKIEQWCSSGMNGEMNYLGQNIEKRINPGILLPGAKSIIVTGINYFTDKKQRSKDVPVISRYAYGSNYQDVIKARLNKLLDYIKIIWPDADGKSFVDSAPVIEKAWGIEAGLGWPGRHSILINKNIGSFFFIGIIVLSIDLDYNEPFNEDLCGTCRICIDSCPTGAINENRTIDARKCIAYLTIESKTPLPDDLAQKFEGRIFGCDKCQDVCPWNSKAKPHSNPEFELSSEIELMNSEEWHNLSKDEFYRLFKNSAVRRGKYERFKQNIEIISKIRS